MPPRVERALLTGWQTDEAGIRCDGSCHRRGEHKAYGSFECARCEVVVPNPLDSVPIPNLLNYEQLDLGVLPTHYPGLSDLV